MHTQVLLRSFFKLLGAATLCEIICNFRFLRLFVIQGKPELELPKLFKAWKITRLTFEFDHEPEGRQRDSKICELASEAGIEVETRVCHSLYDLDK